DGLSCIEEEINVDSNISQDTTWTADKRYRLIGQRFVESGATLTIEPGTTIIGDSNTSGLLVVDRGAKIMANGTTTHPIVFTSDKPVGQRSRGDWGGIIILGNGKSNSAGGEGLAEGIVPDTNWGGGANPNDAESSGEMSYVRIEWGGTEISENNEVNALSIFGVGAGTVMHHIQCKYNDDDGFEWFGGAADLKYGIATGIADDDFDYSFGWTGRGQFWVGQKADDEGDRGIEADGSEEVFDATPLTSPTIANVTFIGSGSDGTSDTGIVQRRGVVGSIYNAIVMGWQDAGYDIDDAATASNDGGSLSIDTSVFFDNNEDAELGDGDESGFDFTSDEALRTRGDDNIFATDSPIVDPYTLGAPDFRAQNDGATAGTDVSAIDSYFDATSYRGAVAPTGDDWTQADWISYATN
ncbi:MAG: hypothetical protein AAF517_08935, partial [Planctomycetota bacterium]